MIGENIFDLIELFNKPRFNLLIYFEIPPTF